MINRVRKKISFRLFSRESSFNESESKPDQTIVSGLRPSLDIATSIVFPSVGESPSFGAIEVNAPPQIIVSPPPPSSSPPSPSSQEGLCSREEKIVHAESSHPLRDVAVLHSDSNHLPKIDANPSSVEAKITLPSPAKDWSIDNHVNVNKLLARKPIVSPPSSPPSPPLGETIPPSKQTHKPVMENSNDPIHQSQTPSPWKNITETFLDKTLSTKDGFSSVTKLKGSDATAVIDFMDEVLESKPQNDRKTNYVAALRKLCGNSEILPTSHTLADGLSKTGDHPRAGGGFADVWEGSYKGQKVAIKAVRVYSKEQAKMKKRFCKEALMWKRLSHRNVLPFIGAVISEPLFWMVSPWMANGNINEYLKSHPQTNRLPLLHDISNGLLCLHSEDIVHGDLKGENILINDDSQACLADFGLTTIIADSIPGYSVTAVDSAGTVRWMAPQLLNPEEYGLTKCTPTKESDIYVLGMVMYEVITGDPPFIQYKNLAVVGKVTSGVRPERPTNTTATELVDSVWPLAEACWHQQDRERPTIAQVLERLKGANCDGVTPSPTEAVTRYSFDDDSEDSPVSPSVFNE